MERPAVCVVGAGPAGLVACKTLLQEGFDVTVLDAQAQVGGTFRDKTYDDGHLVSSKYITAFSDFRMGPEVAEHPSIDEYLAYLEAYVEHFELGQHLKLSTRVRSVRKNEARPGLLAAWTYDVEWTAPDGVEHSGRFDAVCVCSGLHNTPFQPDTFDQFEGQVIHSSAYKSKEMFEGKRVLVVGSGETGLDIVFRAIQKTKHVYLSTRSGFLSVPYVIGDGLPLDTFITNLCECSHLHPLLERFKVKWLFTTPFIRLAFMLGTGSSAGYNQWAGCKPSMQVQRGHLIINKSTAAMPWINRPHKRRSWLGRMLYWRLDDCPLFRRLDDRDIVVKRGVAHVEGKQVRFTDGSAAEFDTVVCATGYAVHFPFLQTAKDLKRRGAGDASLPEQATLPAEHNIVDPAEPTKAFIGFVRPNVGAIPPMAEMQVFWWIQRLRGRLAKSPAAPTYRLLGAAPRTGAYGVDYGAYMHDLARDMGCDPRLRDLARSPRALVAWSLGQAYVTFFRLRGPFALPQAWDISREELYGPVARRPIASNILFVGLIALFGALNCVAALVSPFVPAAPPPRGN